MTEHVENYKRVDEVMPGVTVNSTGFRIIRNDKGKNVWDSKVIWISDTILNDSSFNLDEYLLRHMSKADKDTIAIGEVAKVFGVTSETIRHWEEKGYIKSWRTLGGHRRYNRSEVEALIKENKRGDK